MERSGRHRFERFKKPPLGWQGFFVAVLSSLSVSAGFASVTMAVTVLVLETGQPVVRVVRMYGAGFTALFCSLGTITVLGPYWSLLYACDRDEPGFPFGFSWAFSRACAGVGISVVIAAAAVVLVVGFFLIAGWLPFV